MQPVTRSVSILGAASRCCGLFLLICPAFAQDPMKFQVQGGTVKFDASTNVSALSVHGQSSQMSAEGLLHATGNQWELENLRAWLDPKSFSTGMSLRDSHMKNKVFALQDGSVPELQFTANRITCSDLHSGREGTCPVSGQLTLRGVTQPFAINLKVKNDGKGYRASGDGSVKLKAFGIEPPCQLGVCVADEVKLRLEFQARESLGLRSGGLR